MGHCVQRRRAAPPRSLNRAPAAGLNPCVCLCEAVATQTTRCTLHRSDRHSHRSSGSTHSHCIHSVAAPASDLNHKDNGCCYDARTIAHVGGKAISPTWQKCNNGYSLKETARNYSKSSHIARSRKRNSQTLRANKQEGNGPIDERLQSLWRSNLAPF